MVDFFDFILQKPPRKRPESVLYLHILETYRLGFPSDKSETVL